MRHTDSFGTIALAAYRPKPDLFERQLRSIRDQTHEAFECLISVDGDPGAVEELVRAAVGSDGRFRVIGFEERVGFYLNFERAVAGLASDSAWVALSDQDDYWYPEKLERLLPHLDEVGLVSGQGRVVELPSGRVLSASSGRRTVGPDDLLASNQLTGSFMVVRRDVVDVSLPFPRLASAVAVHDHWIGMCAAVTSGYLVLDEVLQDYHQHGSNVLGEPPSHTRFDPRRSWELLRQQSQRVEGGASPVAVLRTFYMTSIGWREFLVGALAQRIDNAVVRDLTAKVGPGHRLRDVTSWIRGVVGRGHVVGRTAVWFVLADVLARVPGRLVRRPARTDGA